MLEERWYWWPSIIFDHADRNLNSLIYSKNWSRVDYGFGLKKENFRGRRETLKFITTFGYNEKYYIGLSNIYLDKKRHHSISLNQSYLQNDAIDYQVVNNELVSYKSNNGFAAETFKSSLNYQYRKAYYNSHHLSLQFKRKNGTDSLALLNPNYFGQGKTAISYLSAAYTFAHDHRDSKYYPLDGIYSYFEVLHSGFGLFKQNNGLRRTYLKVKLNHHFPIHSRWHFSTGNTVLMHLQDDLQPFFIENGLGYSRDYLRGYEYYVIPCNQYVYTKNNLKYTLIPKTVQKLNLIPFEKFNKMHYALYFNVGFDWGYAKATKDEPSLNNNLSNIPLYSMSTGIDLVTYYDNVMSFTYTINKKGDSGFFIHFQSPIQ